MASCRQRDEDNRPSYWPTAYSAAKIGSEQSHSPEQIRVKYAVPGTSIAPTATSKTRLVRRLHLFSVNILDTGMVCTLLYIPEEMNSGPAERRSTDARNGKL
ncbi:hypothetical protein EVAR_22832_1 [Eumeta japonica]|uniref:Uncharacterized protein n=1 Tax=Eumeta variegata TaxID=151549 RepID=A0A4C1VFK2_EUMVA|nr:hypothetical protein EVAR_22832_1 [Eumeta japonica]